MFSNSRPVPSKAALKLLYQLAYISSGTAVGVATLCAEERRRRTLLVQKIADNATRIRQSPRYVHTLARRTPDDGEDPSLFFSRRRSRRPTESDGIAGIDIGDRAARGPELPSVVDAGYTQLLLQQPRFSASESERRSDPSIGRPNDETRNDPTSFAQASPRKALQPARHLKIRKADPISHPRTTSKPQASGRVAPVKPLAPSPAQQIVAKVPQHSAALPEGKARARSRPRLPRFVTVAEMWQRPIDEKAPLTAAFLVQRKDVKHDVALFMDFAPQIDESVYSYCEAVAVWLTNLSATKGLLAEVRSLIPWLSDHNALSPDLILAMCESCYNLVARSNMDVAEIRSFYTSLFGMPEFRRQDLAAQFQARFAVVVDLVRPAIFDRKYDLLKVLLSLGQGQEEFGIPVLKQHYDNIHAQGSIDHAKNLLVTVCSRGSYDLLRNDEISNLVRHCLDWALAKHSLGPAISLWILKSWTPEGEGDEPDTHHADLASLLDNIAEIATHCQSIAQMHTVCRTMDRARAKGKPWYSSVLGRISLDTRTSLAKAFFNMDGFSRELLDDLRQGVPPTLLTQVDEVRVATALKRVWTDTRGLPAVFAKYDNLKRLQQRHDLEPDEVGHLGPAEMALIEVCNLAQQSDRAVHIFKAGKKTRLQSTDSLSLAALTLAHKQDWTTIRTLLDTAHKSQLSVGHDELAMRRLNVVVWLHTHQHNASETWAFITSLADSVGFKLNAATAKMMTKHLVSRASVGQPTLLPEWMRFVKNQGVDFEIDSALAVAMMRHFYLAKRVPHVILMHLCRKLLVYAPQLRGPGWRHLIKQAVGYDLRVMDTRRPHEMQGAGAQNVRNTSKSEETVPVPMTTRSSRLHTPLQEGSRRTVAGKTRIDGVEPRISIGSLSDRKVDVALSAGAAEPGSRAMERKRRPPGASMGNMHKTLDLSANEDYNKVVEAFYAHDPDSANSATVSTHTGSPVDSDAGHQDEVLPIDIDHFGRFVQHQYKADLELDEENDDAMLVDAIAAQQAVGPSGFNSTKHAQELVAKMVWKLSIKRYRDVLEIYESSLGPSGLPVAPLALTVAVQARIRLDAGDVRGATDIIDAARSAGFNVICAMAPMLIRDMRMLRVKDKHNANQLRVQVMDYYRAMSEAGFPVSHHVGVSAANVLIDNGCPLHGLNLLDSIYRAKWAKQNPINIVAMSVYLKGYTALKSLPGIMWVVTRVMKSNMYIDRKFLHRLRVAPKAFERHAHRSKRGRRSVDRRLLQTLRRARALCSQRRIVQRHKNKLLGAKLVRAIGLTVRVQQASNDTEMKLAIKRGYFGRATAVDRHGQVSWRHSSGTETRYHPRSYLFRRRRAQQMQALTTKPRRLSRTGPHQKLTRGAAYHRLRLRQYRAFREERRVISQGQSMSFRDYLALKASKRHRVLAMGKSGLSSQQQSRPHRKERPKQTKRTPVQPSITSSQREPHWLRPLQNLKAGEKIDLGRSVTLSPSLDISVDTPLDVEGSEPPSREQAKQGFGPRKSAHERVKTRSGAGRKEDQWKVQYVAR